MITIDQFAGAARHRIGGGDGRGRCDLNVFGGRTTHVVGHHQRVGAGREVADAGRELAAGSGGLVAPSIGQGQVCGALAGSIGDRGSDAAVAATVAGDMRRVERDGDFVVVGDICNSDARCSCRTTTIGIGHHKGVGACREAAHLDIFTLLFHVDGSAMSFSVLHGLDAERRFATFYFQNGIAGRGFYADGLVVPACLDGGGELGIPPHRDFLHRVKTVDAVVVGDELHGFGAVISVLHCISPSVAAEPCLIPQSERSLRVVGDFIKTYVNGFGAELFGGDKGRGEYLFICRIGSIASYVNAFETQLVIAGSPCHFHQLDFYPVVAGAQPIKAELDVYSAVLEVLSIEIVDLLVGNVGHHVKRSGGGKVTMRFLDSLSRVAAHRQSGDNV